MATWISNFLAKLHLDRSSEHFILGVLYNEALNEDEKSASIFEFLEQNVKATNVNLQDAVSELFAQYQRNGLYMMVAPEYHPRAQAQPQRPQTQLRPPVKEFVPKFAQTVKTEQQQEASEDDAEIHGVDPSKAGGSQHSGGGPWARIDDDDDGNNGDEKNNDNDGDVFRVPSSQIYGEEEYEDYEGVEGYEGEEYYGDDDGYGGYDQQYYGEQGWTQESFEHDAFDPCAPPSMDDMRLLQNAQGYPPFVGQVPVMSSQYPSTYSGYYNPYDPNMQYQQQQQETQDMSPLEMLQQILADMKPEQIEQAFEENGHDMDAALSAIIAKRQRVNQQAKVADPLQQFIPKGDPRATQTCRFFLQGNCFRKDCWYSHDLDSMVCRFWLKGECMKGAMCEFSHGLDAGKLTEVVEVEPVKQQVLPSMDEWDFPSLSSPAKPASSKNGANKSNGPASSKTSKSALGDSAVDTLAKDLNTKASIGGPASGPKHPVLSYSATAAKAASKPLTRLRPSSPSGENQGSSSSSSQPKFNLAMAPATIPWLETGSALNQQYLKARAKAAEYASARNRCFEMATQAYLRNDGAAASRYSAEGRQYNEKMMATHREASQQIFATRNASTVGSKDGSERNETWIDLHGLHVEESLVFLDQFMEKLENEVYTGVVYVVTGTGHHSTLGLAKVRRAVLEWLTDWGYHHREISVDGVHGGLVAVQVIKGRP
ncbi:hypothetical protein BGZ73_001843 [Actinomortierella ambigua]|nr:hypothetical protein BGZ73_001843 [Actinomortierella ambigua]